jgi:hypothetical protein
MPSADQHRNKAEGNRKFLATISLDDHPDWVVVAAFYTAVHLAERLRAASGDGDSRGHEDRLAYLQDRHPDIHGPYYVLQNASMLARYQSYSDFYAQFDPHNIPDRILARLEDIEAYLVAQFG